MPTPDPSIGITSATGDRGVPALVKDSSGKYAAGNLDASGNLKVNVAAGGTSGTQYADGDARSTATGNLCMVDDGTLIQSMKGDSSGRPAMNIEQVAGTNAQSGSGTATGALRVELPTNGTGVVGLNAGTNAIGKLTSNSGVTIGAVEIAAAQTLATVTTVGAVTSLTNALPAGTNAIGKLAANSGVDIGDVDVTSIAAGTNKIGDVDIAPRTTGGWSVGNFTSGDTYTALTNSAQVIKGSAGKFGGYYIYNPNSSATYVMVYNIAAASVTVGTSTAKLVFAIPATSAANLELIAGIPFDTALSIAAATTGGGNSAPASALEAMVFYV